MNIEYELNLRRKAILIPGSCIEHSIPLISIDDAIVLVKKHDHKIADRLEHIIKSKYKGWGSVEVLISELRK